MVAVWVERWETMLCSVDGTVGVGSGIWWARGERVPVSFSGVGCWFGLGVRIGWMRVVSWGWAILMLTVR